MQEQQPGRQSGLKDPRVEALKRLLIQDAMKDQGGIVTADEAVKFALQVEQWLAAAKKEIGVE